jgi:hypothetical protein
MDPPDFGSGTYTVFLVGSYLIFFRFSVSRSKGFTFKTYLPDKPAKYGFLFKALGDAVYAYIYRTNIYAGKPVLEPTEYYIQGKKSLLILDPIPPITGTDAVMS